MKIIIFDTETTGLQPGQICQLSYLISDENTIEGKNFFFSVDYIEPGAEAAHGFSLDKLKELSGGHTFSNHADEVMADFSSADLVVAHNIDFDKKFLEVEFARLGKEIQLINTFCTMKHFTPICQIYHHYFGFKYPTLEELLKFLSVEQSDVLQMLKDVFNEDDIGFHDARFDIAGTFIAFVEGMDAGFIRIDPLA